MNRPSARALRIASLLFFCWAASAEGAEAPTATPPTEGFGLLVMAHGGGVEWNRTVLDAVEPLRARYPVEVAFGMADACSIQEAATKLESRGAHRIGVARLFVSGESWRERTEQILGLRDGAPASTGSGPVPVECAGAHGAEGHHEMAFFRLDNDATFAMTHEGLLDAPEMGTILAERASALSKDPPHEDVLVLAHGPEDDAENERWLAALDARAAEVRAALPFHRVGVQTLREDWPAKRKAAEEWIVAFVAKAESEGRRVIVVPYRLVGFGPFAKVFEGHAFVADERGLLPHEKVTDWIARQAEELRAGTGEQH